MNMHHIARDNRFTWDTLIQSLKQQYFRNSLEKTWKSRGLNPLYFVSIPDQDEDYLDSHEVGGYPSQDPQQQGYPVPSLDLSQGVQSVSPPQGISQPSVLQQNAPQQSVPQMQAGVANDQELIFNHFGFFTKVFVQNMWMVCIIRLYFKIYFENCRIWWKHIYENIELWINEWI